MTAPIVTIENPTPPDIASAVTPRRSKSRPDRDLVVYSTKSGRWHWKVLSPNGQVVQARSGPDGYRRRDDATVAARRFLTAISSAAVRLIVHKADGTIDDRGLL
ncbi:hypothetical protein SEA_PCORAL7_60 [Gordonia phage PCoral7]|uniref:DUF1508 domain-containing protein n=1 Tax=Gordonia phage Toast TaxID=2599852 RepID=A0A5J6TBD7_9CAUD|nr:hypothetical protein JZX81_gp60 [Gordonia phage Toast]QFG08120.1 hypothetical protein PBI_TOAST_60 [Gordonia phage Toast]UVF60568.1 hypothetical protein SEA_PCORAL7_60 [Gordonia phage PCoral7]